MAGGASGGRSALVAAALGSLFVLTSLAVAASRPGVESIRVVTYPSATSIEPRGPTPAGSGSAISLNAAIGELEDGIIAVSGARQLAAAVDRSDIGPLTIQLLFAHFVSFGSRLVPDALEPWEGAARDAEEPVQPIWVQVGIPRGTPPGTHRAHVTITADGEATAVPVTVKVWPVTMPEPGSASGGLLTSFQLSAQTYVNTAASLYGLKTAREYLAANAGLYAFLSRYRISPASWGYGEPTSASGYTSDSRWWRDAAANMVAEVGGSGGFSAMRLPISSNRYSPRNYIAGLSPFQHALQDTPWGNRQGFAVLHVEVADDAG